MNVNVTLFIIIIIIRFYFLIKLNKVSYILILGPMKFILFYFSEILYFLCYFFWILRSMTNS